MKKWGEFIFIKFKKWGGAVGRLQGSPMLNLPCISVFYLHVPVFLPSIFSSYMFYGNTKFVKSLIRTNMVTVAIGLLLKIIMGFPKNIIPC